METLLANIRATLIAMLAQIDAVIAPAPPPAPAPDPAPPAPAPAPAPAGYVTVPSCFQLFGPVQGNGAHQQVPGNVFDFQGNALTASTKQIYLGANAAEVEVARAVAVWAPGSVANEIEIVKFDNGPANIERIGLMVGQNVGTPIASGVILTEAIQAMVTEAKANGTPFKHLGFRMRGTTTYTLYEVRVEISWKIPA